MGRLSAATRSRLDDLIAEDVGADAESAGGGGTFFTKLKADPGALGPDSLLAEVNKLQRVRGLQLPSGLFADVSEKPVAAWPARAAKEYPSDLRAAAGPVRYTLLATLCHVRETEITDSLVELFIQLVQKINTRAEKKVEGEFNKELKRVRGKEGILLRLAEAAVAEPGGTVRKVVYPVAGEFTLKAQPGEPGRTAAGIVHRPQCGPHPRQDAAGPEQGAGLARSAHCQTRVGDSGDGSQPKGRGGCDERIAERSTGQRPDRLLRPLERSAGGPDGGVHR
ncbi:hypothetical protein ACFYT4_34445 [Streptomyces sp. NPDC004609]|uniref:hypothetical protein n=1 Tax=Streptomyces sp. NPDC004609 TaxID=3364704 RepID=UPI00368C12AD